MFAIVSCSVIAKRTNFGKRREGTNKLAHKSAFPSLLLPTFFLSALSFSSPSSSFPLPIFDSSPPSFDGSARLE